MLVQKRPVFLECLCLLLLGGWPDKPGILVVLIPQSMS
jgi:hypothetical protein